jgi:2-polyprenyl-3-methyl-5-hydroxy-6-metoxy-1,4-benzoquinol methylase
MLGLEILKKIEGYDPELMKMRQWIIEAMSLRSAQEPFVILDVGCGNGRILNMLSTITPPQNMKLRVVGVEVNEESLKLNRQKGFECYSPNDLSKLNIKCDLLILSHIIEHFSPAELFKFMDSYLDYINPSGCLLIATPLYSNYFYLL